MCYVELKKNKQNILTPLRLIRMNFKNTNIYMYNLSIIFKNCSFVETSVYGNGNSVSSVYFINIFCSGERNIELIVQKYAKLFIQNCVFENIVTEYKLSLITATTILEIFIRKCSFRTIIGSVVEAKFSAHILFKQVLFTNINPFTEAEAESSPIQTSYASIVYFLNSKFIKSSGKNGGVISLLRIKSVAVSSSYFLFNKASGNGSSLFLENVSFLRILKTSFELNTAKICGGAVFSRAKMYDNQIVVSQCLFRKNSAEKGGGAVYSKMVDVVFVSNCKYIENFAVVGGALYITKADSYSQMKTLFISNKGIGNGGSIYTRRCSLLYVHGCVFFKKYCSWLDL